MSEPYWAASRQCKACGRPSVPGSYLCEQCRRLMGRVETHKDALGRGRSVDKEARLRALQRQWDPTVQAYVCHYTGVPLTDAHGSRRYATWEHVSPGVESSVVLVADLVNRMKTDLSEAEFKAMVRALAARFNDEPFDLDAFPPNFHQ